MGVDELDHLLDAVRRPQPELLGRAASHQQIVFLTEDDDGWGPWKDLITKRYPQAPVYLVRWGSKELKNLGSLAAVGAGKVAAAKLVANMAANASRKAAAKIPYLGTLLVANDILANPWILAKTRAGMTIAPVRASQG